MGCTRLKSPIAEAPGRGFKQWNWVTLEWVCWFNRHYLLAPIGHVPPAEARASYYQRQTEQATRA